ncbi:competence protein ComK [Sporosarcina jeotgali]|uniref:Competence protein ComK n=1 Tax=Sporosarcina jeotgali TaxID=3020056 RepID=A0ABZ0KYS0_9BACL|nr:competence protein ComK [Sporosarcina sp. B2O-1]WOV84748.1 competence protein ComK [Sporosarcina sp. B2O-1]
MTHNQHGILTTEASIIFPHFTERGELHSKYMEGDRFYIVEKKPYDLIDFNLRLSGTSLKGAVEGAHVVLGSGTMTPVVLSKKHSIYWTPIMSPKSPHCIWVSLAHIRKFVKNKKGEVTVYLKNESTVDLPCSYYKFERRISRAYTLRYKIESNADQVVKVAEPYLKTYYIRKKLGLNYEVEE